MTIWRKWSIVLAVMLFVGITFFSHSITTAVVKAVGVETLHAHTVLTVVYTIGVSAILSMILTLLVGDDINNASSKYLTTFFTLGAIFEFSQMVYRAYELSTQYSFKLLVNSLNLLFLSSVIFAYCMIGGIFQLIIARRQKQARMAAQTQGT